MIEQDFTRLLSEYTDALGDRRRFAGLLRDFMPGMALQSNLLLNLYDVDIHREIEKTVIIDNSFTYRFVKRLCDDFGVSRRNSEWAVSAWCSCYGGTLLGKKCDISTADPAKPTVHESVKEVTATFDVTVNDYVDDWRNVYEYEVVNGGVVIKKYITFDEEEVTVPENIEGYSVIEIGEKTFENCKGIYRVNLPDCLLRIGSRAFSSSGIKSVLIPQNIQTIGSSAFSFCGINSVDIPEGVTEIDSGTFGYCKNLSIVKLPNTLKKIGRGAFQESAIAFIDIPDGTLEIDDEAFSKCHKLTKVRLPNSIKRIGRQGSILESVFSRYGATGKLTIYCNVGSEALQYARKHSIQMDKYENYSESSNNSLDWNEIRLCPHCMKGTPKSSRICAICGKTV